MIESDVFPPEEQDHFWFVVRECLKRFYTEQAAEGLRRVPALRRKVNRMPLQTLEMFYHAEPLDVARDLAGVDVDESGFAAEYLALRDGPRRTRTASSAARVSTRRPSA